MKFLLILVLIAAPLCAQNLPAGTQSTDAPSSQGRFSTRIAAAENALEKRDFSTAATELNAAITAGASGAQVYYDLGFAEERIGDDTAAEAAYAKAIAANPAIGQPRLALGLLEARNNQFDKARTNLLAVSDLKDEAPVLRGRALRALARIDSAHDADAAQQELVQAIKLTGETPEDTMMTADLATQSGDLMDSEAAYRRALTARPGSLDATAGLAHVLVKEKKTTEAETVLSAALKDHPDDPRLISQLALLYAAEAKADLAIPLIEKLRASQTSLAADPQLSAMLAHLYAINGEYAKAETLDRALLAKTPDDPALLDDLGSALVQQRKYAEAEAVLSKAVSLRDKFPAQQDWAIAAEHLAFAATKNGHPKTAIEAIKQRDTVLPASASSIWLAAISYDALHQHKQAAEAYTAFLAAAKGKFPTQEFQARHRLVALDNMR